MFQVENLYGKPNNVSFMNYIATFDVARLAKTFIDSTFDFSRIFTDYVKFAAQPNNKTEIRAEFYF